MALLEDSRFCFFAVIYHGMFQGSGTDFVGIFFQTIPSPVRFYIITFCVLTTNSLLYTMDIGPIHVVNVNLNDDSQVLKYQSLDQSLLGYQPCT